MSNDYALKHGDIVLTKEEMRKYCQRPGRTDKDGKILYFTEQNHKKECDINLIIKKYDKTGLIDHIAKFEGSFGDHTQMDYKEAMDLITNSKKSFEQLPVEIKKRFNQDPGELLHFMEKPENRKEAIELGLINQAWTEETDGLGEHVKEGDNIKKEDIPGPPKVE